VRRLAVLVSCLGVLVGPVAAAGPLLAPSPGGSVFTGPTSAHVSSIFHNPAATGLMSGTHVLVLGTASVDALSISRDPIRLSDGEPLASERSFADVSATAISPGGFVGVTSDLGTDNLTLGLGVLMPHSEALPDLPDSVGYHALGGSFTSVSLTGSASYRVSSIFYAGVGFDVLFTKLELRFLRDRVLDGCAAAPCGVEDPANAERWKVETGWDALPGQSLEPAFTFNFGILAKWKGWWIAAAVDFLFFAAITKTADVSVTPPGEAALTGKARVTYDLPFVGRFGLRRPIFGAWDLLLHGTWTRSSVQQVIDVRFFEKLRDDVPEWLVRHRGFQDIVAVEVGVEQPAATRLRLGVRGRFESSLLPPGKITAATIDGPKLELSGGLELRLSTRWALTGSYTFSFMLPQTNDPGEYSPRAAIDCTASGYDLTTEACTAVREGRAIPTAAGRYGRLGNSLSLGISFDAW
jgi:long-subunit fatty acid transport protein